MIQLQLHYVKNTKKKKNRGIKLCNFGRDWQLGKSSVMEPITERLALYEVRPHVMWARLEWRGQESGLFLTAEAFSNHSR